MALCFLEGVSNEGNEIWGRWVISNGCSIDDNIVQYCRKAFGKRYKNLWIDPVCFDDKYFRYTKEFFAKVGVELYPKLTNLKAAFRQARISWPKSCEEWYDYRDFVWEIVQHDIDINKRKGVEPKCVMVSGVRFYEDNKFKEKIISVREVSAL